MRLDHIKSKIGQAAGDFTLRNVRIPLAALDGGHVELRDGLAQVDVAVRNGIVSQIGTGIAANGVVLDMKMAMVWPRLVDCHTHIDKGQVVGRTANPDGSFPAALEASAADRVRFFSEEDMRQRSRFILRSAVAYGTGALRSHVDASAVHFARSYAVLQEVAQEFNEQIEVQLAPFTGLGEDPDFVAELARVAQSSHGVLSAFLFNDSKLPEFIDFLFRLALDHDLSLDFHADENLDANSHCLRAVAQAAQHHRFERPVLVGHACALSAQSTEDVNRTLDLVAETTVGIVALPLCNSYLQDRHHHMSPRQRGIAPLHEISQRGIPVAIGSDNVRDAFHAYGDMDLLEVFRQSLWMMHLDHPVGSWPGTISTNAAQLIGQAELGRIGVGRSADFIVTSARDFSEFGARPTRDRLLLVRGEVLDVCPPEFSELDSLKGMKI